MAENSPFGKKNKEELHEMFLKKGYGGNPSDIDAFNSKGSYINPKNGRKYWIDNCKNGRYSEPSHIDVSRPKEYTGPLGKKRFSFYGEEYKSLEVE